MNKFRDLSFEDLTTAITVSRRYNWYGQLTEYILELYQELDRRQGIHLDWQEYGF
jgi:hypothetical protein